MKNVLIAGVCFAIAAMLPSCKQKDYNKNVTPGNLSSMNDVFNKLSLKSKTLTVDATAGGSFYGNSGTRYYFAPNSFQTENGTSVTGQVQIEVCEYLKKGDMLFSGMLPISNREPLLSGGEIYVKASQQLKPVFLKPGYTFSANIPTSGTAPAGMQLFMGQQGADPTKDKVNWTLVKKDTIREVGVFVVHAAGGGGGTNAVDTLRIISDSLKMCNADQFMTNPNYQNFTVAITVSGATLSPSSTVHAYALYDTYKGVWPLGYGFGLGSYSNGVYEEHHVPNIPVHFVAFTLIDGKFYGGSLGVTPSTGSKYTITLSEVNEETFKNQLNDL